MAILASPRKFHRHKNEITIFLRDEEWVPDVPLPEASVVVKMGEKGQQPFHPMWHLFLEADKTVELLVGQFKLPFSFEESVAWYQAEVTKRGWLERPDKNYTKPNIVVLNFYHPEVDAKLRISITWLAALAETRAMFERVVFHSWPPVEQEVSPTPELLSDEDRDGGPARIGHLPGE